MFRNTILPKLRRVIIPSWGTIALLVAWGAWWAFIIIGASIIQAQDNPTRSNEGVADGQPPLSYLDALYFMEVATSSCGLGDIVPVTDGGRAIMFVWSFVGTGVFGIVIGGMVLKLTNWIFVDILMSSYWDIKKRKRSKKEHKDTELRASTSVTTPRTSDAAQKRQEEEDEEAEKYLTPLEARVLPWYALPFLNGIALVTWATAHLIYAAVLQSLEADLGNLGDLTPNNYGNVFYFSLIASQTICFGTDYNPKTSEGRAFWLFWHQIAMMSNTFLFITVTLALLKFLDSKTFWLVGKILHKVRRKDESESESESESEGEEHANGDPETP